VNKDEIPPSAEAVRSLRSGSQPSQQFDLLAIGCLAPQPRTERNLQRADVDTHIGNYKVGLPEHVGIIPINAKLRS
jgi:hypothetical protein